LRILTWHVHGSYLWYLAHGPYELILPTKPGKPEGYGARTPSFPWPDNVVEVPAEAVPDLDVDVVLYQSRRNWEVDRHELLSDAQRRLPQIYLEHDPPREHPTDTRHPAADEPELLLVQVTPFNDLMWDSGSTPTRVIEHGVVVPDDVRYSGELARGVVVVNGLAHRGRRCGADVFARVRDHVPLDLFGIESAQLGGNGDVPLGELHARQAAYRFFFNPIRYTSLGLAVCEAMMVGLPVVGLATTEMVTAVTNGESGWVDTNVDRLVAVMQRLLADLDEAQRLGAGARKTALERFGIERFSADWAALFADVAR
jgi:hypothetical protein